MTRTVAIGADVFEDMRVNNDFLVDKTAFVGEWWRSRAKVTLVCRPRRFGKTLTLSMIGRFLSNLCDRDQTARLFCGLEVSHDEQMMGLMGRIPVVSVSFADVKDPTYTEAVGDVKQVLCAAVEEHAYLMDSEAVSASDRRFLERVTDDMSNLTAKKCLKRLCHMLQAHWGIAPVVLLDEYDTPLVEAWAHGYWKKMVDFVRGLFNSTFKTNDSLERALITGITHVAQESIFSDMNNLYIASVTAPRFETSFGFTKKEVMAALEEYGLTDSARGVRNWYDGYSFGSTSGVYNPWSITNFLADNRLDAFWTSTSSNALVSRVVRAHPEVMSKFEVLLAGDHVKESIDLCVDFHSLDLDPGSVWPLLLSAGYLTYDPDELRRAYLARKESKSADDVVLALTLTNLEVTKAFKDMVKKWFAPAHKGTLNSLSRALLEGDAEAAEQRLGTVVSSCVSTFDTGTKASKKAQPERFFHGLVLGMLVDLIDRGYEVRSNPESGLGRLDVAIVPSDVSREACVLEFKVAGGKSKRALEASCQEALAQIKDKHYDDRIISRGVDAKHIHHYGIAFFGKQVLVRHGA